MESLMSMGRYLKMTVTGFAIAVICSGCGRVGQTRSYLNPETDFSFYSRIALLPLKNLTSEALAGEKMTEALLTELLIGGKLDVMDIGQFNAVVSQVIRTNVPIHLLDLSTAHLKQAAELAKVQGIFMGTIQDYRMISIGGEQYPVITLILKFIDAPTGTVVWRYSTTVSGGPNIPVLSIGETFDLAELGPKVCQKAVEDFFDHIPSK